MSLGNHKPRGGRPATGKGVPVQVRLHADMLAPLDAWISTLDPQPSRPEAVRLMMKDWLTGHGYLRHREDPEGANGSIELQAKN